MDGHRGNTIWIAFGIASALLFSISVHSLYSNRYEVQWTYFNDAKSFSKVEGTILRAEIGYGQESESTIGDDLSIPQPYYFLEIQYSFSANNIEYKSNRIAFAEIRFSNREAAKLYLSNYPAGGGVHVYYDPAHPEISVLDPQRNRSFMLEFIGVSLLPALGVVFAVRRYFKSKYKQAGVLLEDKLDDLIDANGNKRTII